MKNYQMKINLKILYKKIILEIRSRPRWQSE